MDTSTLFDVKVLFPLQWQCLSSNADIREKGKVVLVTGGAKGIGRMISEGFVTNGAKVYISSRDAKACEQACKELNALGK
jgi:NADP-dependent 3-hydroxy acid dehydrogenase YdfG